MLIFEKHLGVKFVFITLRILPCLGCLYHPLCKKLVKHFIAGNIIYPPVYKLKKTILQTVAVYT